MTSTSSYFRQHVTNRTGGMWRPKVGYDDQATAQVAADELAQKRLGEYQTYVCGHCGAWHVGRPAQPRYPRVKITREEALDMQRTLDRLEAKDRRRHLVAMAGMQPRRLP